LDVHGQDSGKGAGLYIHFALVGHLLGGTKAATITLAMIKLVLTPGGEQR
jgi:hypothetical protein